MLKATTGEAGGCAFAGLSPTGTRDGPMAALAQRMGKGHSAYRNDRLLATLGVNPHNRASGISGHWIEIRDKNGTIIIHSDAKRDLESATLCQGGCRICAQIDAKNLPDGVHITPTLADGR